MADMTHTLYLHSMHVESTLVPLSLEDHVIGWRKGLVPSCLVHLPLLDLCLASKFSALALLLDQLLARATAEVFE